MNNYIFLKEFKINFGLPPNPHVGSVFFFRNVPTPMEFLKYEGINFIILIFELIVSNLDNLNPKNLENDKIVILNLANSLGCIPNPPIPNQLLDPFLTLPMPGIKTRINRMIQIKNILDAFL